MPVEQSSYRESSSEGDDTTGHHHTTIFLRVTNVPAVAQDQPRDIRSGGRTVHMYSIPKARALLTARTDDTLGVTAI